MGGVEDPTELRLHAPRPVLALGLGPAVPDGDHQVADDLAWARAVCLELPEAYEEEAWVGTRWKVRGRTFAHVLEIVDGCPPPFAAAAGTRGPAAVLTFRSEGLELDAVLAGPASFGPLWNRGDVGIRLGEHPDWAELAELVQDSYRLRAPKRLLRRLDP